MSLKNFALAFVSMFVVAGAAKADDLMDDLAGMDLATINDSAASVEEFDLDSLDVDQLAAEAGDETDAIETCFRRFGYRRGGWGGWGRGWGGCYGYGYRSFHSCYSYHRPVYHCYRPVIRTCYTHCAPVISYWGCF